MCKVCFSRTFRCSRETALRRNMSQQEWFCCKHQFFCTTDTIRLPALPLRLNVDRVIRPLARSFRRVASPGQYAFSLWLFSCRCDSSYWDGRRPAGFLKGGSPALCSQFRVGALRHADAQSACLRGMRRTSICKSVRFRSAYNTTLQLFVQPFPAAFFLCSQPSSAAFPVYPVPAGVRTPAGRAWSFPARDGTA